MNDTAQTIYQTALKKAGKNGKALRDMALYAVEIYNAFGKTSDEMDAVYAAYRRSEVNSMICAVVAMDGRPDWFQRKRARHADDYLSLYKVCSLTAHDRAWMLAEFVKQDDAGELDDLQIWMERVSELKTRKPRERKPRSSNCKEKELYALLRKIRDGLNETMASDNEIVDWINDALANGGEE